MQLGKALVGAIIGGALGIAALIAIEHFAGYDRAWLAIVVAVLTGLGVRAVVSTSGHPSYLRGALTGLLALAAYWGGTQLFSELTTRGVLQKKMQAPPPIAAADATEPADAAEVDGVTVPIEPVADKQVASQPGNQLPIARPQMQQFSTLDFVFICIAGLIAYELGRGSAVAAPKVPIVPPPDAT